MAHKLPARDFGTVITLSNDEGSGEPVQMCRLASLRCSHKWHTAYSYLFTLKFGEKRKLPPNNPKIGNVLILLAQVGTSTRLNWASTRENRSSVVCEQHRRRPACACAQSAQRLRYSRFRMYNISTCCR